MALDQLNPGDVGSVARGKINAGFSAIDGEATTRGDADTALGGRIDGEATTRGNADTALGGRIDGEATTRGNADTALGVRIDGEATARGDADTALGVRIDGEATTRGNAVTALGVRIDGEATTRGNADTALGGRIDDEATARRDADTALGGRIDGEATTRGNADTALGGRIDGEATTRGNADAALGGRIDDEATTRRDADTALGGRIDGEVRDRSIAIEGEAEARRADVAALRALAFIASRPGESPQNFVSDLVSASPGLPPTAASVTTPAGQVARVPGAAVIATAALFCPEPNRLYRLRYVVRRQNETLDPAGDGVSMAVAWYDATGTLMRGTTTIVAVLALTVAMGRRQFGATISRDPPDVGTLPVPVGAVYGRAYVQTYGDTAVTDVEVIAVTDVTDQGAVSIDLDDIADRLTRVEASQAAMPAAVMSEAFYDALIFG